MEHHETKSSSAGEKTDLSIPLAIVFSGIIIAGAIIYTDKSKVETPTIVAQAPSVEEETTRVPETVLAIKADDHVVGNPDADIVLIEYSDVQCPYCQRFHETMNMVMTSYGNNIAWVYRHFPLDSIHPYARKGGEALECAAELGGTKGFLALEEKLFDPTTQSIALEALPSLAAGTGLDKTAFSACLSSGKYAARVDRDFKEGASVGVRGTPFSVAWNKKTKKQEVINGAQSFGAVSSVLESLGAKPSK